MSCSTRQHTDPSSVHEPQDWQRLPNARTRPVRGPRGDGFVGGSSRFWRNPQAWETGTARPTRPLPGGEVAHRQPGDVGEESAGSQAAAVGRPACSVFPVGRPNPTGAGGGAAQAALASRGDGSRPRLWGANRSICRLEGFPRRGPAGRGGPAGPEKPRRTFPLPARHHGARHPGAAGRWRRLKTGGLAGYVGGRSDPVRRPGPTGGAGQAERASGKLPAHRRTVSRMSRAPLRRSARPVL